MISENNTPTISGLILRPFQGESDFASIAAVLTSSEIADHSQREVTAEQIANAYQNLRHCNPYRDMVIAEVAGEMIGYARGWWEDESDTGRLYIHNGFLVPGWRRKGVGRAMLHRMEVRLREVAASHPADLIKELQVNTTQFQLGTVILLEQSGYLPIRYFYEMVRPSLEDIQEYPLPEGVEIRPAQPDQYPAIWKSVDEGSQDEWGYKKTTDEDYRQWLASPHFQPELWQIAWDTVTQKPVGHVLTFINPDENEQFNRKRGYAEGIGVDRQWRRRGLARALISLSLRAQKAAGMTESGLAADSESSSDVTRLYESCGFKIVKRDTLYRKRM